MATLSDRGILILGMAFPSDKTGILPREVLEIYSRFFDGGVASVTFLFRRVKLTDPQDLDGFLHSSPILKM